MISKRIWIAKKYNRNSFTLISQVTREGWFLFGFLPLYVRDLEVRKL